MSTTTRIVHATPDEVWKVLADGWLYPLWVVGASRMREVDDTWPAVGSKLHHSVGAWPLLLDDNTEVTAVEPPASRCRCAPAPGRWARRRCTSTCSPVGTDTEVRIEEDAVSGPGTLAPKPLRGVTWP